MNINNIDAIKVCDIELNESESDRKLWNISWVCDKKLLSQDNGRCYFIVVNSIIYKIGYSDCRGGIRSTITSYMSSGNSGRPSDRTHGIHVLIAEELLKNNKVEFYFSYIPESIINLVVMDGTIKSIKTSISGKILESENMKIFIKNEKRHPIWNLQEAGAPWPKHIQESRNNLLAGNCLKLSDIKKRLGL